MKKDERGKKFFQPRWLSASSRNQQVSKAIPVIESISRTGGFDTSREEHAGLLNHRVFQFFLLSSFL
jgi:hypothetical protein